MDIRNFFAPKNRKNASQTTRTVVDDDDDDFSKGRSKAKRKKVKGIIFESDSSEEDPLPRKVKKKLKVAATIAKSDNDGSSMNKATKKTNAIQPKAEAKPELKEISPGSFFGACSKVVLKEKRLPKRKTSHEDSVKQTEIIEIDDDLDFDGTLNMTPKKKPKRDRESIITENISNKYSDHTKKKKRDKKQKDPKSSSKKDDIIKSKTGDIPKLKDEPLEKPKTTPEKSIKELTTELEQRKNKISKDHKNGSKKDAIKKNDVTDIPMLEDKSRGKPKTTPEKSIKELTTELEQRQNKISKDHKNGSKKDAIKKHDVTGILILKDKSKERPKTTPEKARKELTEQHKNKIAKDHYNSSEKEDHKKNDVNDPHIPILKDDAIKRPKNTPKKSKNLINKETQDSKNEKSKDRGDSLSVNDSKSKKEETKENLTSKIKTPHKKHSVPDKVDAKSNHIPSSKNDAEVNNEIPEEKALSAKQERFVKYLQYQNRSGPKAPGSKEIPVGADNCLEGMTFVITGVLESLERDDAKSLIERYGGKVTGSVSGRTSYLILGDEAGESKIKKAEQHKTKQIDEDGLLDLIRSKPGKRSKYEIAAENEIRRDKTAPSKRKISPDKDSQHKTDPISSSNFYSKKNSQNLDVDSQESVKSLPDSQKLTTGSAPDSEFLLWVDKYKPKTLKQVIGQQGAKSNVEKLKTWLLEWHQNNRPKDGSKPKPKPKVSMFGGGDPKGTGFKAALLSGPPGVGKTTAATLVCKELGFQFIELNASDTRSKRTLKEEVSHMLDNSSISSMFGTEEQKKNAAEGTRNALIMDEIDGMAGNQDRGGMQEVIQLIKTTKIPIICMCNDRSSPKMRSLTNYCFDLRFQRPRVEQITGAMMSICYKEGLKIQAPALQALIRGCNQDVRQVLYNLSMLKASGDAVSYDGAMKHSEESHKDVSMGVFDVARKLLTAESASLSINDKLSLFFIDYSMIPLFVQDNYPLVRLGSGNDIRKQLSAVSRAAESICLGDRMDKLLRKDQAWSALPTIGLLSTVVPSTIMRGSMTGMINFPSFFGKLSTTGKNHRLLQELKFHSSISTSGASESSFNMDYLPYLRYQLTHPLIKQTDTGEAQLQQTINLLNSYELLREDFDSIVELGHYPGKPQLMSKVDTKVKSAFTRGFNKENHKTPYALQATMKKSKRQPMPGDLEYDLEGETQTTSQDDEEVEEEPDAMMKAKPAPRKKSSGASGSKTKKISESKAKKRKH